MIDTNNNSQRRGATDALSLLLRLKREGKLKVVKSVDDSDSKLHLPPGVEVEVPNDEEPETEEEISARLEKIKSDNSPEKIKQDIDDIKQTVELKQQDIEKIKELEKEAERKRIENELKAKDAKKTVHDFKYFKEQLENAIMSQITENEKYEDTYSKFNPTYADSDLLMPGRMKSTKIDHPIINVYFDNSGSLSSSDIARAEDALSFLTELKNDGVLDYTRYWFAEKVNTDKSKTGRGTSAYPDILKHVVATGANNVLIFTDEDFDMQSGNLSRLPYVKVDGCVWWVWSGSIAKKSWPHLVSRDTSNTYQYKIAQ